MARLFGRADFSFESLKALGNSETLAGFVVLEGSGVFTGFNNPLPSYWLFGLAEIGTSMLEPSSSSGNDKSINRIHKWIYPTIHDTDEGYKFEHPGSFFDL
jgi:hypothetical protein